MIPPRRRLGLLDLMIVVAALGVAAACSRGLLEEVAERLSLTGGGTFGTFGKWALSANVAAWPFALALTVALIVVGLRTPRPPRLRLARRPGLMACFAAVSSTLIVAASLGSWILLREGIPTSWPDSWRAIFRSGATIWPCLLLPASGISVLSAWSTQALVGSWRAQPTWDDRLGRLLGVFWIAAGAIVGAAVFAEFL